MYDCYGAVFILFAVCSTGKYGPGCTLECKCDNGGSCDPVSGACICSDGWLGATCDHGKSYGFFIA